MMIAIFVIILVVVNCSDSSNVDSHSSGDNNGYDSDSSGTISHEQS